MTKDSLSQFKKKKSELPAPEKVSTHFTASSNAKPLPKPQKCADIHLRTARQPLKSKPSHARQPTRQPQQAVQQQAAYRSEDFQFIPNVDNFGINILVTFQGTQIYIFQLPCTEYQLWQTANWSTKYEYVKQKIDVRCFASDNSLVHAVVKTIMQVLDTLFAKAAEVQAQQNQAQQAQIQVQQKRRV